VCVKNYLEKHMPLALELIRGLLRYWPLTAPAKEVIFISEIEEVIDLCSGNSEVKFAEYGPDLLKRLILTSQGMHY
jgi:serine/threonine-protein phosphatase 2A regulatory subunit B'